MAAVVRRLATTKRMSVAAYAAATGAIRQLQPRRDSGNGGAHHARHWRQPEPLHRPRAAQGRPARREGQRRGVRGPQYAWANSRRLQAALAGAGVAWVSLRNGFYAATVPRLLGRALETGELVAPADGPVSWTTHADLAEAAARLLAAERTARAAA